MADSKSLIVSSMALRLLLVFRAAVDRAPQLAVLQPDANPRAHRHRRRVAQDCGPLIVPAPRVAAAQHGQWAQGVEASGQQPQARVRLLAALPQTPSQSVAGNRQPCAHLTDAPPRVTRLQPGLLVLPPPRRRSEPGGDQAPQARGVLPHIAGAQGHAGA